MDEIGSTLREARMRDRIDISEVEARTKIRAKYLRAIENEEWDLLPGPVYAKSFLRTYSDFLGLDSRTLVDEFKRRYERPSDHDARPMGSIAARDRDRNRGPHRRRLPAWVPIGVVVIAVIAALFVVGSLGQPSTSTTASSHTTSSRRGHHHLLPQRTNPTSAVTARATLQMVPTAPVYVCLVNGRGKKLIDEQTFTPGETIPTETAHKLLLTLGNASVQMKVDGKAVPVAPSPTAIRLLITPAGVSHIPSSLAPTCP